MKWIVQYIVLNVAALLTTQFVAAHAVWIETEGKAAKNRVQVVKVFYGEFPEGLPDSTSKWYSDVKSLEVYVTSPGGKRTKLKLEDAFTCLNASFTPQEEGLYYISTEHTAQDLGGTTKYTFIAMKPVLVGDSGTAERLPDVSLAILSDPAGYSIKKQIELTVLNNGQPYAGGEVQIMTAAGWVKTIKANQEGKIRFTPVLKGAYVIETSTYTKQEGEWNQKAFTHAWSGATTHLIVK